MTNDILLVLMAFGTSAFTAVTGIGGGMMLIALMPGFIPAAAIIPVHASVQIFSNASRAMFGWSFLRWEFVLAFICGSILGGLIAAGITRQIDLEYTPLIIAVYILYTVWAPKLKLKKPIKGEFVVIGMVQTGLSMMVGATGPMGQAALLNQGLQRDAQVVTAALMMTFTHLIKIVLFALLGFSFIAYWKITVGMSIAVIFGARLGTHIRYQVPERLFNSALKWLLTLLAVRMIYLSFA